MGKLIVISKDKNDYKMELFINDQKICNIKPSEEKYLELKPNIYTIHSFSKNTQSISKKETADLNKNVIVEVCHGFINPKINISYIIDSELDKYNEKPFEDIKFDSDNSISIEKSLRTDKKDNNTFSLFVRIFLGVIIIIICFSLLFGESNEENNNLDNSYTDDNEIIENNNKKNTINCNDKSITIKNIKRITKNESGYVPNDKEWVAIYILFENKSNADMYYNESDFNLVNSNGEIIKPTFNIIKGVLDYERLNNGALVAGGKKEGYIMFENGIINDNNLSLRYVCQDNLIADDEIMTINLNDL